MFLVACGTSPSGKPDDSAAPPPLCAGDTCLADTSDIWTLIVNGEPRVSLPLAAFALAHESADDPTRSYDPTYPNAATTWETPLRTEVVARTASTFTTAMYYEHGAAHLTATVGPDDVFTLQWLPEAPTEGVWTGYRVFTSVDPAEGFYGLGELFDRPEHRGTVRPMHLVADFELESSYNEAHVPVPLLIGTNGWGLFVEDDHPTVFDVAATDDDRVFATIGTGPDTLVGLTFYLLGAPEAIDVTARYYSVTGPPALPAPWALGPLLWRDENTGQSQVLDDIDTIRALDLATSGIWIDRPYATGVNTFDFEATQWPDAAAMITDANAAGLRVGVWHTPYINEDMAPELYAEAATNGYFPPAVPIYFNSWGPPIDFTNPDAMAWWQGLIGRYTALGVEGYKLDYGEDVFLGVGGFRNVWAFADGSDERTMHKEFPRLYHQAYGETLGSDGGFLLNRAGTWRDHTITSIIWPGDLDADLSTFRDLRGDGTQAVGGLPSAVSAAIGLGPSGYPFFGSDTGGYRHSPPSVETFVRWFEHTALSAVMQVGNSSSSQPWEILADEPELLDLYRSYARLHLRLTPYLWTQATQLATGGRPLLRPFGLQQPHHGQHPADVYFLGEDLLVAPVIEAGAETRTFPCPEGAWRSWWDGTPLTCTPGADVTVPAPLEVLPLFLQDGALIPLLRPTIDTWAPVSDGSDTESFTNDAGVLFVRAAVGANGTTTLWDGSAFSMTDTGDAVNIDWQEGTVFTAGAGAEVIGFTDTPSRVTKDGASTDEWSWNDGVLHVPGPFASISITR